MITPTTRRRALVLALPALYVAIAAVSEGASRAGAWVGIAAGILVAIVGARLASVEGASPRETLAASAGLSIVLATCAFPGRPGWAASARAIGALVSAVIAAHAIARIEGDAGLAAKATEAEEPRGTSARIIARVGLFAVAVAWGTAAFTDCYGWSTGAASWIDAAPIVAAIGGSLSLFVVGAVALLVAGARRLELAAPPRALACAAAAAVALLAAIAIAIAGVLRADSAVAVTSAVSSFIVLRLARVRDVGALAKRGRRALALGIYGGPVAVLAALAVEGQLPGSSGAALVLCLVGVVVGAVANKLEEPFLPAKGAWLEAIEDARRAAQEREPRAAIAHALVKLREAASLGAGPVPVPSPELWMLHPTRVMTVNAAGYLSEKEAELPADVFDIAAAEPHATVRTAVLEALEVRRADLRPLLEWLRTRGALFATVIAETGEPDGLLVVPTGGRHEPMTLEETAAAKRLADAFVAVCQTTSARERHLARERDLKQRIDALDDELAAVRHAADVEGARHALASSRLARPATVGIYSAAARMAFDALERRVAQHAPIVVLARPGMDAVPYVARAHLGGPRRDRPLVVVDGTSSREHDLERWRDDRASPLALADGGLLVLLDGASLPRDVQVLVARALGERRPPFERAVPLDIAVAMITTTPLDVLVEEGRLGPELAARFTDAPAITLPGLHERPEDLRSIVADRLAREGLRTRGRPVGIEAAAFARLVEHPFEGEDVELATIVTRLVARAQDDVVRASDVDALGFVGRPAVAEQAESVRTLSVVGGTTVARSTELAARTVFVVPPPPEPEPRREERPHSPLSPSRPSPSPPPPLPPFETPSLARPESEPELPDPELAEAEAAAEAAADEDDDLAIFDSLRPAELDIPIEVEEGEEGDDAPSPSSPPRSKRKPGLGNKRKGRGKRRRH